MRYFNLLIHDFTVLTGQGQSQPLKRKKESLKNHFHEKLREIIPLLD